MDENSDLFFLEANLIPGVAQHTFTSYFTAACWINQFMEHKSMILKIVETALSRSSDYDESNILAVKESLSFPSSEIVFESV